MATYPAMCQASYSYASYMGFQDDICCEIIEEQIYDTTPAPLLRHQEIVLIMGRLLGDHRVLSASQREPIRPRCYDRLSVLDASSSAKSGTFMLTLLFLRDHPSDRSLDEQLPGAE